MECAFVGRFNLLSPSVNWIDKAVSRIKLSKTGDWGKSVELEGNFGDLYSNCNVNLP